jgi:hypothetical protein
VNLLAKRDRFVTAGRIDGCQQWTNYAAFAAGNNNSVPETKHPAIVFIPSPTGFVVYCATPMATDMPRGSASRNDALVDRHDRRIRQAAANRVTALQLNGRFIQTPGAVVPVVVRRSRRQLPAQQGAQRLPVLVDKLVLSAFALFHFRGGDHNKHGDQPIVINGFSAASPARMLSFSLLARRAGQSHQIGQACAFLGTSLHSQNLLLGKFLFGNKNLNQRRFMRLYQFELPDSLTLA